jgi:hypothetical protein
VCAHVCANKLACDLAQQCVRGRSLAGILRIFDQICCKNIKPTSVEARKAFRSWAGSLIFPPPRPTFDPPRPSPPHAAPAACIPCPDLCPQKSVSPFPSLSFQFLFFSKEGEKKGRKNKIKSLDQPHIP